MVTKNTVHHKACAALSREALWGPFVSRAIVTAPGKSGEISDGRTLVGTFEQKQILIGINEIEFRQQLIQRKLTNME